MSDANGSLKNKALGWFRGNPVLAGVVLVCVVGGIAGAGFFFWPKTAVRRSGMTPSLVQTVAVQKGQVSRAYKVNGTLRAVKFVQLYPEIDGRVAEILFQQGAVVKKDDALVRLDDRLMRAKLLEAEAQFRQADSEFSIAKEMHDQKFLSRVKFEEKMARRDVAAASVKAAEFSLSQTLIKAPFDGVVGLLNFSEGATINRNQEVTTVLVLDPLYVDFALPDSLLGSLDEDAVVDVIVENSLPMEAKIEAVDTKASIGTHSVQVRALLPNKRRKMRPGQFASVTAYLGMEKNALMVPSQAVLQRGTKHYVYVTIDGYAVERAVVLGVHEGNRVQIKDGLKEGEMVITVGHVNVTNGAPVRIDDGTTPSDDNAKQDAADQGAETQKADA